MLTPSHACVRVTGVPTATDVQTAGERAANLLTIIGSAIRNDLDMRAYLDDILRRALAGETDWSALTPGKRSEVAQKSGRAWGFGTASEHPESIREYRKDERQQAADRKRTRRARRRLLNKSTGSR